MPDMSLSLVMPGGPLVAASGSNGQVSSRRRATFFSVPCTVELFFFFCVLRVLILYSVGSHHRAYCFVERRFTGERLATEPAPQDPLLPNMCFPRTIVLCCIPMPEEC